MSFEQHVIENYGKSANQIRLEAALSFFVHNLEASECWKKADEFVDSMRVYCGFESLGELNQP